jgi:hypothetical protein
VLAAAGKLHQSLYENDEFELDIPFIHFTYSLIQARLVNFSELVHAFPNLVETILRKRDQLDVGEMVSSHHSKTVTKLFFNSINSCMLYAACCDVIIPV